MSEYMKNKIIRIKIHNHKTMKNFIYTLFFFLPFSLGAQTEIKTETKPTGSPLVNFDDYLELALKVKEYRKDRLVTLEDFKKMSSEPNTVILDTRSDSMFKAKHIKGAIHLDFTDFTQDNLERLIPDKNTRILIYCNNNFLFLETPRIEDANFASKVSKPTFSLDLSKLVLPSIDTVDVSIYQVSPKNGKIQTLEKKPLEKKTAEKIAAKPITLALNIPTFINLVGYGYENIYELGELVIISQENLEFEGTSVEKFIQE
jgi:hypothetical protein